MAVSSRRCSSDAEKARSLAIYNTVLPRRAVTAEEVENFERAMLDSAEFLASLDGADVGSAAAGIAPSQPDACLMLVTVLPERRRRGAGSALYAEVSRWAAEHGLDVIETRAEADDDESLAYARRRGFEEQWRETGFELDVATAALPAAAPGNVEIVSLAQRPELEPAVYDVAVEALPDVYAGDWRPPPRERWLETHVRGPGTSPETVLLALAHGDVIGYAKLNLKHEGRTAEHGMTGVKRAWRGRGVARTLKLAQIAWAKEHGLEKLTATNELRNEPIVRLNESLGYRRTVGRVGLRGPLSAAI